MALYTSYFAKLSTIEQLWSQHHKKVACKSIARWSPTWFNGPKLTQFAPPYQLLQDVKACKITDEQYALQYWEYLSKLLANNPSIFDSLIAWSKTTDIVLLCYEAPNKFCHRQVFAKFIKQHFAIDVKELSF